MSRYRPPQAKSSPYITPAGFNKLVDEEIQLWRKRAEVTQALSAAAAEGDRSENAEYIYRKKQLAEIDRRIRYLQKRLPDLNVVDKVANDQHVFFGAYVSVEYEDGTHASYRIVGADEIDSDESKGYISVDSPLARALLKKQVDDEIELTIGDAKKLLWITKIHYA